MKSDADKSCEARSTWSKVRHEVAAIAVLVFSGLLLSSVQAQTKLPEPLIYFGAMDGSAAVALDSSYFASASDEDSVIRIYHRETGGMPTWTTDFSSFLQVNPRSSETDIEAATRVGNRAYWITSHGCSKNGKERPDRQRFFATDISTNGSGFLLSPVGKPCTTLLTDLVAAKQLKRFDLATAAARAPKYPGGLSIEGLAATPDGHLLIAFRNPVPQGRALIVPLLNPHEVIQGEHALFGMPIQLNLHGLGIRDMASWRGEFIIVAGSPGGGGSFKLFRWDGGDSTPRLIRRVSLKNQHPEAVIVYQDTGLHEFQLLSDDSTEQDRVAEEIPASSATRRFRGAWVGP